MAVQELKQLVNDYQPDLINGDYCTLLNSTELQSKEFLAWLYNDSPVKEQVIVDDRWVKGCVGMLAGMICMPACSWGTDARCKHGGYKVQARSNDDLDKAVCHHYCHPY